MRKNFKWAAVAVAASAALALSACSTASGDDAEDGGETISLNAFSVMEAANVPGNRRRRRRHLRDVVRRVR